MSRPSLESSVAILAGALIALIIATGAAMIPDVPSHSAVDETTREAVNDDSLTFCFEDGGRLRCIREES